MYRRLIGNTFVSAVAFLLTGFINLLLVPLLVGKYGLAEYGLITLARILLPSGALGIFDFGYSETTTQAIARAREDGDWSRAARQLQLLAIITVIFGSCVALALGLGSDSLIGLLKVSADRSDSFGIVIVATALMFPLLFCTALTDGTLKGFEAYRALRAVDILSAVAYCAVAVACVYSGLDYFCVALAYIASQVLRSFVLLGVAWRMAAPVRAYFVRARREDWQEVMRRSRVLAGSKLLGSVQHQLPPLVIGALFGPASVGGYDLLVRLPRFAKVVLGLLNNAVLPVAARFDHGGHIKQMRRLIRDGLVGVAIVSIPLSLAGAAFSLPILRIWAGPDLAALWPWQAMMFLVALLNVLFSFGATVLIVRPAATARFNAITLTQLVLQYTLAFAVLEVFHERAFILGQMVAMAATFPLQMAIIVKEVGLPIAALRRLLAPALIGMGFTGAVLLTEIPRWLDGGIELAAAVALWLACTYLCMWCLGIPARLRNLIVSRARIGQVGGTLRWLFGFSR